VSTIAQTDSVLPGPATSGPAAYPPVELREPLAAEKVASTTTIVNAAQGIHFASWGENRITQAELERLVGAVPRALAPALAKRYYYFVPLVIAENESVVAAPTYTVDLGDRAVCHRNVSLGAADAVFISTRLVEDRFGLAFEFFINVAHNFVDAVGVPESFASIAWSQAQAGVRGETSQDAWETRRRAQESLAPATDEHGKTVPSRGIDERARKHYEESAFSDALAIYMLSLALDFEYHDLREREYPLLAAPALAERLRHVAALFPPNEGYDFQILYRGKK
jgi:hypothetical protein